MTTPDDRDDQGHFTITDLINLLDDADRTYPSYPNTPPPNPNDPPASLERIRAASPERSPRKRRRARRRGLPAAAGSPGRHERLCSICNHPDREAIEFDFLHWRNPYDICRQHDIRDRSCIYRHAHATGLFALRRRNSRAVLERIVERVDDVKVTDVGVLRALREYNRIKDDGQWPPEDNDDAPHVDNGEANNQADRQTLPEGPHRQASLQSAAAASEFTPSQIGAPASPTAGGLPASTVAGPAQQRSWTLWPIGRWRPRFWPGAPTEEPDPPETAPREGQQQDSPSGDPGRTEE
jgi:hypothetical protein